ncbi:hypothetical protein [Sphingomonas sp. DC1100-1]|jgi:hypothetical protein|uniref:hypothetical protein n=1 Tax=unclassified Sphingomonas TaxID=196159 RepID=UPI003CF1CB63
MTAAARASLPDWPRLMSVDQASAYLSLGSTTLRELGPAPKRHGKRVLYDRRDLDRWADSLGDQPLTQAEEAQEAGEEERRFMERRAARGSH